MFSSPMKTAVQPARADFSMKPGMRWHSVSTCRNSRMRKPVLLAQLDQAIEDRLPIAVAREVVVGDEEPGDALRRIGAHDLLDVVGGAIARLAALHVDDGAEAALERAAAAGIEAGVMAGHAGDRPARQDRQRGGAPSPACRTDSCRAAWRLPASMSRNRPSMRPSPSPANRMMPSAPASFRSGGSSGSMDRQPLTWNPPITTGSPAARNWRPRSSARGNWLDCTPTSPTKPARRRGSAGSRP